MKEHGLCLTRFDTTIFQHPLLHAEPVIPVSLQNASTYRGLRNLQMPFHLAFSFHWPQNGNIAVSKEKVSEHENILVSQPRRC